MSTLAEDLSRLVRLQTWALVVLTLLLLALMGYVIYDGGNKSDALRKNDKAFAALVARNTRSTRQAHAALCALREDVVKDARGAAKQVASLVAFIHANPHGYDGVSADDLHLALVNARQRLADQYATIKTLQQAKPPLVCQRPRSRQRKVD